MAPVLGGFIETIRGNWKVGMLLVALFTSMQLYVNHLQITYYLFMVLLAVGIGQVAGQQQEIAGMLKAFIHDALGPLTDTVVA